MSSSSSLTLWSLLLRSAGLANNNGLAFHDSSSETPTVSISYNDLINTATENAKLLVASGHVKPSQIVGIYFTTHQESVEWCWSIIAAGAIPFIMSPLSIDPFTLETQLANLSRIFDVPTVFTAARLVSAFRDTQHLKLLAVENITSNDTSQIKLETAQDDQELALLLLTSGSTGHSKAVRFTHKQLLASVMAKQIFHKTSPETRFMTWTSFDHSVNFCEVHLHALYSGSSQILVATSDVVTQPAQFFHLLSKHRVSYTFAPNFFLTAVTEEFSATKGSDDIDLSELRVIISGGEASRTATLAKTDAILTQLKAPQHCITSVYGLSETCSAAFYNTLCPSYDSQQNYVFASVGKPLPGAIRLRIVNEDGQTVLDTGGSGSIHLQGPMVFQSYHNDPTATEACITADGWFDTGDLGTVDASGHLSIVGRRKEVVILNGNNYSSFEIEHAIESSDIPRLTLSYTATFPTYNEARGSEGIVVVFNPADEDASPESLNETMMAIDKALLRVCSQRAMEIVPLPKSELPKSTIGKLSRAKLKTAYESGRFDSYRLTMLNIESLEQDLANLNLSKFANQILDIFVSYTKLPKHALATSGGLFNAGVDSIGYMRIKKNLEALPWVSREIPMAMLMGTHSVQDLEAALCSLDSASIGYDPVVPMATEGKKLPLWLFHPGGGESLCWVPLIKYLPDRPLYALRAKGLNKAETTFDNLEEMLDCYEEAVMQKQPKGPYAFLGYCYGGTLAFEMAKRFEAKGREMAFVSGIDNPPDLVSEMSEMRGRSILIHFLPAAANFTMEEATKFADETDHLNDDDFFYAICERLGPELLEEMDISPTWLARWAHVEDSMRDMARVYEPKGSISTLDMFVADALPEMKSYKTWKTKLMPGWADYLNNGDELRLHEIAGNHITLMREPHIAVFQEVLNKALIGRGI